MPGRMHRNLEWVSHSNPERSGYHGKLDVHLQAASTQQKGHGDTTVLWYPVSPTREHLVLVVGSFEMLVADLTKWDHT
jgi:hypothetical protein